MRLHLNAVFFFVVFAFVACGSPEVVEPVVSTDVMPSTTPVPSSTPEPTATQGKSVV